ncbi:MAG: lipocalin-like domain-containing protein [Microbacter sp.]
MQQKWTWTLLTGLSLLILTGCQDYNPKLNGKWQLMTVQTPSQTWVRDSIFYNFDNYTFEIQNLSRYNGGTMMGEFQQKGDSLLLQVVDKGYTPSRFYWYGLSKHFKIVSLSFSRMQLSEADTLYNFRSYN